MKQCGSSFQAIVALLYMILLPVAVNCFREEDIEQQTLFLREILTGRCFEQPPFSERYACKGIAEDLVDTIEKYFQFQLTTDKFYNYLNQADFSTFPDQGIIPVILHNRARGGMPRYVSGWPAATVPVEATPGGAFLRGLGLCGIDLRVTGCPFGDWDGEQWIGAEAAFWSGVYQQYAARLTGAVRVVLREEEDDGDDDVDLLELADPDQPYLFETSSIPNLNPQLVSQIEFYVDGSCGNDNALLVQYVRELRVRGFLPEQLSCIQDPTGLQLRLCSDVDGGLEDNVEVLRVCSILNNGGDDSIFPTDDATDGRADGGDAPSDSGRGNTSVILILVALFLVCAWYFASNLLDKSASYTNIQESNDTKLLKK